MHWKGAMGLCAFNFAFTFMRHSNIYIALLESVFSSQVQPLVLGAEKQCPTQRRGLTFVIIIINIKNFQLFFNKE